MSGINKLSSLAWAVVVSLGIVCSSGVVYATGPITNTFATSETLTAAKMNVINDAVKDLQGNVPSTSCRVNAGTVDAGATRVGPLCVDNARQAASQSWTAAVDFCRAANKRLLTPGEYLAAFNATVITAANGEFEWVDQVGHDGSVGGTAGKLSAGYMGPSTTLTGQILFSTNVLYDDTSNGNIFFRCAR
ncbi:MAG: hypothetical protein NUV75_05165 [Gallionella sp.]|nr:hypothetical protein [Gallionella sp.]